MNLRSEPRIGIIRVGEEDKLQDEATANWRAQAEKQGVDVSGVDPQQWAAEVRVGGSLLRLIGQRRLERASRAFYDELDKAYREAIEEAQAAYRRSPVQ